MLALAFLFGYLLGSIPFGVLLTRLTGGPDLRSVGSGNIAPPMCCALAARA